VTTPQHDDAAESDADLWARALRRDGPAFAQLFDRHRDRVFGRALGLVQNRHDAEDITAAAFFELWRRRRSVRVVDGSVLPWLLVTAVNLSRNRRRATARYERMLRTAPRTEDVDGPDAELLDTRRRLTTAIERLAPIDAALVVLTGEDDLPVAHAAELLGLTPGAARVRLHRARARLRDELHDLDPTVRSAKESTS
jgi:RNA polymerase sigma factor (sigma-70 family)